MATITLENGTDGLFDLLTYVFELQTMPEVHNPLARTDWDALVTAIGSEFTASAWIAALADGETAMSAAEDEVPDFIAALQTVAEQIVIEKVDEAVQLNSKTISAALEELALQMNEESESLQLPSVAFGVTPDGGNAGDLFIVTSTKQVNGEVNPFILVETIDITAQTASGGSFVRLLLNSDPIRNSLSSGGIGGSGLTNAQVGYFTTSTPLYSGISIYSFTTSDSTLPGNWIANVGTLGTAVKSGQPQTDTITVTGTPTSGTFRITCTTSALGTQSTTSLAYNATAAQIQSAIAGMTGFSRVSVTATGTTPDYTHTIKFYGMREAVTTAVVNSTNTGTYTPATPTAYATPSLGSSPIVLVSDGSTLVSASHLLSNLTPRTALIINAWLAVNTAAASGVIEISLTNGVGGTILTDDAGTNLSYTVNATSLATTYKASANNVASGSPFFMLPTTLPASVYLRIRCSTTLPSTRQVIIDNVIVQLATQVYTGGPYMAAIAGPTGPVDGDVWAIAATNDHAGTMSWMMERNFGIRSLGFRFPHVSSSPTITDFTLYALPELPP